MNVMVTGGCGFLGAYVVRDLVKRGHKPVIFDMRPSDENLRLAWDGAPSGFEIEKGDIRQPTDMLRAAKKHNIDAFIHLAFVLSKAANENPAAAVDVNIYGGVHVLELARTLKLKRLVVASSIGGVFGGYFGSGTVLDEKTLPNPGTLYGTCKSFNETMADFYFRRFDVDATTIRLGFIVGLGKPGGITAAMLDGLVVNPVLGRPGTVPYGDDTVSWLDIELASASFMAALEHEGPTPLRVYNSPIQPTPLNLMIDAVKEFVPGAEVSKGEGTFWGKGLTISDEFGSNAVKDFDLDVRTPKEHLGALIQAAQAKKPVVEELFPVQ